MSFNYQLLDTKNKEVFDLGKGSWFLIFTAATPFTISNLVNSIDDLANEIHTHVLTKENDYELENVKLISKEIWEWSEGRVLYLGNDCFDAFDENKNEIETWKFLETGSRYQLKD